MLYLLANVTSPAVAAGETLNLENHNADAGRCNGWFACLLPGRVANLEPGGARLAGTLPAQDVGLDPVSVPQDQLDIRIEKAVLGDEHQPAWPDYADPLPEYPELLDG